MVDLTVTSQLLAVHMAAAVAADDDLVVAVGEKLDGPPLSTLRKAVRGADEYARAAELPSAGDGTFVGDVVLAHNVEEDMSRMPQNNAEPAAVAAALLSGGTVVVHTPVVDVVPAVAELPLVLPQHLPTFLPDVTGHHLDTVVFFRKVVAVAAVVAAAVVVVVV